MRALSASVGAIPTRYESDLLLKMSNTEPCWGTIISRSTRITSGLNDSASISAAVPSVVALTENPRSRNVTLAIRRSSASLTASKTRGASCASGSIRVSPPGSGCCVVFLVHLGAATLGECNGYRPLLRMLKRKFLEIMTIGTIVRFVLA